MEEESLAHVSQTKGLVEHAVQDQPEGGAAALALQANSAETDYSVAEDVPNAVDSDTLSLAAPEEKEPDATSRPPHDTTASTNDGLEESEFREVALEPAPHDQLEAPVPPTKDSISNSPTSPPTAPSVLPSIEHEARHSQAPSRSSNASESSHRRSLTISKGNNVSVVLIVSALETIAASKEAKRSVPLRDSTQRALELIRSNLASDHPRDILESLRLACETRNEKLMIASLDCISKLISYSFFAEDDVYVSNGISSPPPSPSGRTSIGRASQTNIPQPSIVDLVVHTITACHTETSPDAVSLQIVKALLALVLSPSVFVHHSSLLKAVRTVYNVFLLSTDAVNQMVAQGSLSQMVHHIFTRCKADGSKAPGEFPTPSYEAQAFATSSHSSLTALRVEDATKTTNGSIRSEKPEEPGGSSTSLPFPQKEVSEDTVQDVDESRTVVPPQMYVYVSLPDILLMGFPQDRGRYEQPGGQPRRSQLRRT
jgi:brefeldin A-inhibited guanine nucleotide-exchange protein